MVATACSVLEACAWEQRHASESVLDIIARTLFLVKQTFGFIPEDQGDVLSE